MRRRVRPGRRFRFPRRLSPRTSPIAFAADPTSQMPSAHCTPRTSSWRALARTESRPRWQRSSATTSHECQLWSDASTPPQLLPTRSRRRCARCSWSPCRAVAPGSPSTPAADPSRIGCASWASGRRSASAVSSGAGSTSASRTSGTSCDSPGRRIRSWIT